jgi:hypothetical protein
MNIIIEIIEIAITGNVEFIIFGFAATLFSGLTSWLISALVRLFSRIITSGR